MRFSADFIVPSQGEVKETVFLVGKGITYDTGGADVKGLSTAAHASSLLIKALQLGV